MTAGAGVHWIDLVKVLWPIFTVIMAGLASVILLVLSTRFTTLVAHKQHEARLLELERFKVSQESALAVLPSRQQLGDQIARQGDRINATREELGDSLAELGERIAGLEASNRGVGDQVRTLNQYLHTLLERGLKP